MARSAKEASQVDASPDDKVILVGFGDMKDDVIVTSEVDVALTALNHTGSEEHSSADEDSDSELPFLLDCMNMSFFDFLFTGH